MWKLIGLSLFLSAMASAIPTGVYRTKGWSHYQNGEVTIAPWGHKFVMTAMLQQGNRLHAVKASLQPLGSGQYQGNGLITVNYGNHTGCQHRMGIRVFLVDGKLFLRENTPRNIPYNPYGPCTAAGPYVWFDHPEAYEKQ